MILCSRLKCGCLASALLADYDVPREVRKFTRDEERLGRIVAWEDRQAVWAERCLKHEQEYRFKLAEIPQEGKTE